MVAAAPMNCRPSCDPMPLSSPEPPNASAANTPVRMAPMKPPTPWTPKTSSESS